MSSILSKSVTIDDMLWEVTISKEGEISFAHIYDSNAHPDGSENWLWRSWDAHDSASFKNFIESGIASKISPFKLKRELLKTIATMIRQSRVEFFYFVPTSENRGRIYSRLAESLISEIGGEWTFQIIDNYWFYFTKS